MFTLLFILGYTFLGAVIVTIEFIYWVYTGATSIAWAEHLLGILASKLFLQIIIPCIFLDIIRPLLEVALDNVLDKIKTICYNKRVDNQRR